jgi:phage shock protein A
MLKARASAAKANEQLQNTTSSLNTSSAMAAFERMEEKVLQMEAKSQAAAELAGADLESQFASLEAGGDVDFELAAMKAQLSGGSVSQEQLPAAAEAPAATQSSEVDAELEELRAQIDQL